MAKITLKGSPLNTISNLPKIGQVAPNFRLTKKDLTWIDLSCYKGKKVILNIFPSIDTPVCASSVKKFNEAAAKVGNTSILCISMDLPFATGRFCGAEGVENVEMLSNFRGGTFGTDYGVRIVDGPLEGLFARAVVVINEKGIVMHSELVPEIAQEPDYDKALKALA
jgi:thiol peroxidase